MCLAIPGKILDLTGDSPIERRARVSFGGIVKQVSLAYTPDAKVGEYVIVHAGFALNVLDEAAAERSLQTLVEAGVMREEPS